jgi:dTDP-glucose 4,6-dehydratase
MKYLVTGGAGFIGSNFVHYLLAQYPDCIVINLDKLTYAGNLDNHREIEGDPRYTFVKGDIADPELVNSLFADGIDIAVNFAAETHVDRSIGDPSDFITTDVYGTYVLLEAARVHGIRKFIQISTDEVYGTIEPGRSSVETDQLLPRNPYSASKAGADRLAYSYFATYGLPLCITRASNNYGFYQYPEKLIPLFVTNLLEEKPVPIYGDGKNIRDWLHVMDHCSGIDCVIRNGKNGEVYNIGGGNERENIEVVDIIFEHLGKPDTLKTYVKDRLGHDRRYSLNCTKLASLGWQPAVAFEQGLRETIDWYVSNRWWWEKLKSGEYLEYYKKQYVEREKE